MKCNNFRLFGKIYILLCLTAIIQNAIKTCGEVQTCFFNTINPEADKYINICQEKSNCDDTCVKNMVAFDECFSNTCNCKPEEVFRAECFNNCKLISKNEKFKLFADCLYEPCMPSASHRFLICVIIFIVLEVIVLVVFFLYKWRDYLKRGRKGKENDLDSVNEKYSAIN